MFKVHFVQNDNFIKQNLYTYSGLCFSPCLLATVRITKVQYATKVQFRDTERQPRIYRRETSESSGLSQCG